MAGKDGKAVAGGAGLGYRAPADACGAPAEGWPSGLRRTPGKRVHRKVSGVRIPLPPPICNILILLIKIYLLLDSKTVSKTFSKPWMQRQSGQ